MFRHSYNQFEFNNMKVLVTGSAGFIGYHLVTRLLQRGDQVIGIDNLNDYYDVNLKYCRLRESGIAEGQIEYGKPVLSVDFPNYQFIKLDLTDAGGLDQLFAGNGFDLVVNLAAQAGVRYSLVNPAAYIDSNVTGFLNVLESCRNNAVTRLVYASSSSVYGLNNKIPFSTADKADRPISVYAASKKTNELLAHTYSHLFGIQTTGLRFFTVYGPWGRPDMALYTFTKAIKERQPISVFNNGDMRRDFTFIDDIIDGLVKVIDDADCPSGSCNIYNIGRGESVNLMDFIHEIEKCLGTEAIKHYYPMQDGDVAETWADTTEMEQKLNYRPKVSIAEGVEKFVKWYADFYSDEAPLAATMEHVSAI